MNQYWTKFITLVMVAGGSIYLGGIDKIDSQAVVALLGACLGYVFGNGHGIVEGKKIGGGQ